MIITGKINNITYIPLLCKDIKNVSLKEFDINNISSNINIVSNDNIYSLSKWAGPKRSRTYPYAKVYDTLKSNLKIAVIPILKDEGLDGDFDYLQFDTVSLMSLLNVYIILVPFVSAVKNPRYPNKISKFKIDNSYVLKKIKEIQAFASPAIHYNSLILDNDLMKVVKQSVINYKYISKKTGVKLHNPKYVESFIEKISKQNDSFKMFSREKAKSAQNREMLTLQPNEKLHYKKKASITIENHLGGLYYFTTDEIYFSKDKKQVFLRESKHSNNHKFPSTADIKDALIKMIVYCNLNKVNIKNNKFNVMPVLRLSSTKLRGSLNSGSENEKIERFIKSNKLPKTRENLLRELINEARTNKFELIIEKA